MNAAQLLLLKIRIIPLKMAVYSVLKPTPKVHAAAPAWRNIITLHFVCMQNPQKKTEKGKVELSKGLRAVYTQMPLMWKPGYFQRALDVMEKVSQLPGESKICKDTIDVLKSALASAISSLLEKTEETEVSEDRSEPPEASEKTEADLLPEYLSRFQDLSTKLESLGKIEPANLVSLTTSFVEQKLPESEKPDIEKYEACLKEWEQEQSALSERERELREKARLQYEALLASRAKSTA